MEAEVTPSASKVKSKVETKKPSKPGATPSEKKPAVKPAKAEKVIAGAKRGPKQKAGKAADVDELDMSDIEEDLVGEPETAEASTEKVKPLRMKISKAKERALMKEFGLDETVLSEEDLAKRRLRLKALIKLGKTRGYLTHGEISDHLPDKLVDAETMEVVISMLNDMQKPCCSTTTAPLRRPKKKPKKRQKRHSAPWTASSVAPPTRCACTCAKWVPWNC